MKGQNWDLWGRLQKLLLLCALLAGTGLSAVHDLLWWPRDLEQRFPWCVVSL